MISYMQSPLMIITVGKTWYGGGHVKTKPGICIRIYTDNQLEQVSIVMDIDHAKRLVEDLQRMIARVEQEQEVSDEQCL